MSMSDFSPQYSDLGDALGDTAVFMLGVTFLPVTRNSIWSA